MPPRRRSDQANGTSSAHLGSVTGPRSALTSFLREQGITGNNPRLSYAPRRGQPAADDTATTTTTGTADTPVTLTSTTPASEDADQFDLVASASTSASASVAASIADANAEAGPSTSAGKKRKGADPAASKASSSSKKKKQKKAEINAEDDFSLAGMPHTAPKKGRYENRLPGSIAVCAECGKKFTVSKYTASNPRGSGVLCAPCTSESIEDRASFPSASKAVKKPAKKKAQRAELETLYTPVPTLQQTCLAVVGHYAADVEALGDIGPKNLDRVAKVLCKNRALNGDNLKLFLEVGHRELRLYDCTNIKDHDLGLIASFCPHLERLTLNLCGRLDDDVIDAWLKGFKELRHLSLYAPYLVTGKKWVEFFSQGGTERPELETFQLRMSSRFDDAALHALVQYHQNSLAHLQLAEVGRLTSDSLRALYPLKNLVTLDLARLGTPQGSILDDDAVIALLEQVGSGLAELTLDGNEVLTEKVLIDGVKKYCGRLKKLSLADCVDIHSEGVEILFGAAPRGEETPTEAATDQAANEADGGAADPPNVASDTSVDADITAPAPLPAPAPTPSEPWASPGLHTLNLHRLGSLSPHALSAILAHSGRTLRNLSLHSCDELDAPLLTDALAPQAPDLEVLDLSFVRATDNFVVQALLDGCKNLRVVFLHGNNRVTADVPRKMGVQLRGLENAVHSEIPPDMPW